MKNIQNAEQIPKTKFPLLLPLISWPKSFSSFMP